MTGLIAMNEKSTPYLRRRRKTLIQKLPSIGVNIVRGSLLEQYKPCGKPRCRCADGPGHGPKYYLSVSHPGRRPELDYVPGDYVEQVEQFLANFKKVRQILEEISTINREILRRREHL
jgi:hypothetical protein